MSFITLLVAVLCSDPNVYEKFQNEGATKGLSMMRCERAVQDCYLISGNIKWCIGKVMELE